MKLFKQIKDSYLGINQRNLDCIFPGNLRKHHKLADDKSLTKSILEQNDLACPQTYALIDSLGEIESTWQSIEYLQSLVIKPARGHGGNGILILKKRDGQWYSGKNLMQEDQIYYHIANIIYGIFSNADQDLAILEEYIISHDFFKEIYSEGVPDLRIITHKTRPIMAMLRMPTQRSKGKANLHQGGLAIGVDMQQGTLKEVFDGKKYTNYHPDSHNAITGKQIPYWNEILDLSLEVAHVFPLEYLGIDIILDQYKGPLVMEINSKPGLGIQLANKQGLRELINN